MPCAKSLAVFLGFIQRFIQHKYNDPIGKDGNNLVPGPDYMVGAIGPLI